MKVEQLTPYLLIALVLLLTHNFYCNKPEPIRTEEVKYDTIKREVTINNWQPRITVEAPDVPRSVDTAAILRAHFATNHYDTSITDSSFSAKVNLTVSQNKLQSFSLKYAGVNKTTTITLREPPSNHIYLGAFAGGKETFEYGPQAIFLDKKNRAYTASYSLTDKSVRVGVGFKIK